MKVSAYVCRLEKYLGPFVIPERCAQQRPMTYVEKSSSFEFWKIACMHVCMYVCIFMVVVMYEMAL